MFRISFIHSLARVDLISPSLSLSFHYRPTTGLDPNTRRFVWDYILEIKEKRIIILTTHSMEEADALCTRIGIMVNGELKSLGTPQELKHMHGGGYRVIVRLHEGFAADGPGALLQVLKGEYDIESDEGSAASASGEQRQWRERHAVCGFVATNSSETFKVFNVQREDVKLGRLFELLESKREELGIMDYSVSQTTMEEVFRKFAKFQVEANDVGNGGSGSTGGGPEMVSGAALSAVQGLPFM